jgi:hypothetical protein
MTERTQKIIDKFNLTTSCSSTGGILFKATAEGVSIDGIIRSIIETNANSEEQALEDVVSLWYSTVWGGNVEF